MEGGVNLILAVIAFIACIMIATQKGFINAEFFLGLAIFGYNLELWNLKRKK